MIYRIEGIGYVIVFWVYEIKVEDSYYLYK